MILEDFWGPYQAARDLVSDSWQMNMGNRRNSGNCCTFTTPSGGRISIGIRGDSEKSQGGIKGQRTTDVRLFRDRQGHRDPGLVKVQSCIT